MELISWMWSKSLLTYRPVLWMLFIVNAVGTVYGYMWYGQQLIDTYRHHPLWQIVFVPDSPTASLFFTLSLVYLLFSSKKELTPTGQWIRTVIEALGVVTSIKYGIWAVSMIAAGGAQGDEIVWQQVMLVISHLGMAIEALLFIRFMSFGYVAAFGAACWLLLNDMVDYTYGVFPWLPDILEDDLAAIRSFTFGLTVFSLLLTWLGMKFRKV